MVDQTLHIPVAVVSLETLHHHSPLSSVQGMGHTAIAKNSGMAFKCGLTKVITFKKLHLILCRCIAGFRPVESVDSTL